MTHEEMLAALKPARLPATMASPDWHEIVALIALGMLLAVMAHLIALPFLRPRPSRLGRIRATRGLAPQERLLAIARILGYLPARLRPAAYGAEPVPPDDQIERIIKTSRKPR
ncbi:hypothetical protein [Paracoccus seriniphilus]|uniref:Uncharacterized protein n=1 Tax=Paracoccus seriniphilus TaxID=184748 RepID=A0A239PLW6_9RHOB|nr:hypothetical protein [Paracoccus seriniphilus]WCR13772.1 hypothetical protein JHW44_12805 [Paracoccus seriniphilus]SNT68617.1 hypothetical protein SAMN05444959_101175 [Paracoccus seriniphilus]